MGEDNRTLLRIVTDGQVGPEHRLKRQFALEPGPPRHDVGVGRHASWPKD
jgi:hypothetical protein